MKLPEVVSYLYEGYHAATLRSLLQEGSPSSSHPVTKLRNVERPLRSDGSVTGLAENIISLI